MTSVSIDSLPSYLKEWRKKESYTQNEAANLINCHPVYYSNVERGKGIGNEMKGRLEKALGVEITGQLGPRHDPDIEKLLGKNTELAQKLEETVPAKKRVVRRQKNTHKVKRVAKVKVRQSRRFTLVALEKERRKLYERLDLLDVLIKNLRKLSEI